MIHIFLFLSFLTHSTENSIIRARCFLVDEQRALSDLCALRLANFEQKWNHNTVHYLALLEKREGKDNHQPSLQDWKDMLAERLTRESREYSFSNLLRTLGIYTRVTHYINRINTLTCPEILWDDRNFTRYLVTGQLPENAYGIQVMKRGIPDPSKKTKITTVKYLKICKTQNNSFIGSE